MSKKSLSVTDMHDEHREWQSQHSMWLDDINIWQSQLKKAMHSVNSIVPLIGKLLEDLAIQRANIEKMGLEIKGHEHSLASNKHFGITSPEWRTIKHQDIVKQMKELGSKHEQSRKQSHLLVSRLNELTEILEPLRPLSKPSIKT